MRRSDKSKHTPTRPRGQHRGTIGARYTGIDTRLERYTAALRLADSSQPVSSVGLVNRWARDIREARRMNANTRDDRVPGAP